MSEGKSRSYDLGDGVAVDCGLSADRRWLKLVGDIDERGLTRGQVKALVAALKKMRGKMKR